MKIKVFEAFSGIGTQRMALRNLGIEHEVVAIAEIDKYALKSYEAIHGDCPNLGDISKIDPNTVPDHDLFTYSFPCQDISVAGKQKGLDMDGGTRSGLLWECQKVITAKKPKYLLMENVKNLVGKKHKPNFDKWLEWLESQGYSNYWQILNAKDYGIPQNRERVFCVSILGDHEPYIFPEKRELTIRLKDVLEDEVDEKFYLSEERVAQLTRRTRTMCTDKIIVVANTPSSFRSESNVYDVNGICSTLTARDYKGPKKIAIKNATNAQKDNYAVELPEYRIRKLTPKECWRSMGCSDEDFHKAEQVNSNSQLYKQAGNAIVVDVLEAIFKQIFRVDGSE